MTRDLTFFWFLSLLRNTVSFESTIAKDKEMLAVHEASIAKLQASLSAQLEKYQSLEKAHQSDLKLQTDQSKQLHSLEDNLQKLSTEDTAKLQQDQQRIHELEKEMQGSVQQVQRLQGEIQKANKAHRDTVAKLESAQAQIAKMVSAEEVAKINARLQESKASVSHLNKDLLAKESQIQNMTKGQAALEARLMELQRGQEHDHRLSEKEHQVLLQERAMAAEEKRKDEEIISTLRRASLKLEQDFSTMETKMKKEMNTTKELTDKLTMLRKSMKKDSQAELKKLDELEEVKKQT